MDTTSVTTRHPCDSTDISEPVINGPPNYTFQFKVAQQPRQARATGWSSKADSRRPVDPPPVLSIEVKANDTEITHQIRSMFIVHTTLLSLDDDEQSHAVARGTPTPSRLSGTTVVSLTHIRNPPPGKFFFILNDLSIRQEGYYKLKFRVFEVPLSHPFVYLRGEVDSDVVTVYSPKKFPGLNKSSNLIKELALKGLKVRVRKETTLQNRRKKSSSAVTVALTQSLLSGTENKKAVARCEKQSQPQIESSPQQTKQAEQTEESHSMQITPMIPMYSVNDYPYMQNNESIVVAGDSVSTHDSVCNIPSMIRTKNSLSKSSPQIKLEYTQQTSSQQIPALTDPPIPMRKLGMEYMTITPLVQQQEYHKHPHQHQGLPNSMQQISIDSRYTYPGQQQQQPTSQQFPQQSHIIQNQPSLALFPDYKSYTNLQSQHHYENQVEQQVEQQSQQHPQPQQYFSNPAEISAPYISQQLIGGPPQHGFISPSQPSSSSHATPVTNFYSMEHQQPF